MGFTADSGVETHGPNLQLFVGLMFDYRGALGGSGYDFGTNKDPDSQAREVADAGIQADRGPGWMHFNDRIKRWAVALVMPMIVSLCPELGLQV